MVLYYLTNTDSQAGRLPNKGRDSRSVCQSGFSTCRLKAQVITTMGPLSSFAPTILGSAWGWGELSRILMKVNRTLWDPPGYKSFPCPPFLVGSKQASFSLLDLP